MMYRVKVKQGVWRRHAHQLRMNKTENTDETNEDQSHAELSTSGRDTGRYPLRNRQPTERPDALT